MSAADYLDMDAIDEQIAGFRRAEAALIRVKYADAKTIVTCDGIEWTPVDETRTNWWSEDDCRPLVELDRHHGPITVKERRSDLEAARERRWVGEDAQLDDAVARTIGDGIAAQLAGEQP